MKLDNKSLKSGSEWEKKGYALPRFSRENMTEKTKNEPVWIHFGAGNIFRAFHAKAAQELLDGGFSGTGIIAAEMRDDELDDKVFLPYDNITVLVEFKAGGEIKKSLIASIPEVCTCAGNKDDLDRMREIFRSPSLQLATFTITEKGYKLTDSAGKLFPDVESDFQNGPGKPQSVMGKVSALLYERFINGSLPVAMVSTDNCSDNGGTLFRALLPFAEKWEENGLAKLGFADYLRGNKVSFPMTMIDKITPRPDPSVEELLKKDGAEDMSCVTTEMKTYAAAYVNAEETGYLVIEDDFPNGRPPFEKCRFYMTDRQTVELTEKMKVSACLNPLHTALAVFGCLLGHTLICKEIGDPLLLELVKKIGYDEALPVVSAQSIISPKDFLDEVINVRLPNPYLPDAPQRIATDTSMKLSVRFGETIKKYISSGEDGKLEYIPLVIAGWLRYLMAKDDSGNVFERSPDPFLSDERAEKLRNTNLGGDVPEELLRSIISDESIFGSDLCKTALADKIISGFKAMNSGAGAVRDTLGKAVRT